MIVILSPHPDDAVFSAWHVLTSTGEAEIVNVFSGIPEPGFVTALDLAHGAEESAAWMRRRRAEDRVVLDSIGRVVRNLDFLDVAYRAEAMSRTSHCERPPAVDVVAAVAEITALAVAPETLHTTIAELLPVEALIYAPVGIGGHPDHVAVGKLGVLLAREGRRVRLYADSPYFIRWGLPSWLRPSSDARSDVYIDGALHSIAPEPIATERHVVAMSDTEVKRKILAARNYHTEFAFIDADFHGKSSDPEMMRWEVWWDLEVPSASGHPR